MNKKPSFQIFFISVLILITIFSLFSSSTAIAQVETRMRVIFASNIGSNIDPLLSDLHTQLGSVFNFTSYRLLTDVNLVLLDNQPAEVFVHKGRSIELTLIGKRGDTVEIKIRMKHKRTLILDTQVRLTLGKTIFVGGPFHEHGAAIIALSARF